MYFGMRFSMDSGTEMEPRWPPKRVQKIQKIGKCGFQDRLGDPYSIFFPFGPFWIAIWDDWGVFRMPFGVDFGSLGQILGSGQPIYKNVTKLGNLPFFRHHLTLIF